MHQRARLGWLGAAWKRGCSVVTCVSAHWMTSGPVAPGMVAVAMAGGGGGPGGEHSPVTGESAGRGVHGYSYCYHHGHTRASAWGPHDRLKPGGPTCRVLLATPLAAPLLHPAHPP